MLRKLAPLALLLAAAGCGGGSHEAATTTAPPPPPAQIVVGSPQPGDRWGPADHVTGNASVFEGTVSLELRQDGKVVATTFATASEGAPGRGTFDAVFKGAKPAPGAATIVAYESSAADGSHLHEVRVPVTVTP